MPGENREAMAWHFEQGFTSVGVVEGIKLGGEDEVFFYEVPGWQVVTLDGEAVGTVVRAVEGATDLLEIRPASGGPTFFVPFVDQIVREVDRDGGRVVIDALEGLLP